VTAYDLRCRDAGALSCRGHIRADDEHEFKEKLVDHLAGKHDVEVPNDTIVDYLVSMAREPDRPRP
jgi:predicted small metal-binding protein